MAGQLPTRTAQTSVDPASLTRLSPAADAATAAEIVEQLGLWERPVSGAERPHVMLNMVSTADGRATVGGRSGPISNRADRELFHGLRASVDAVLVGAGTVRSERYGRLIPDAARRALRRERGFSEEPLACIVSGRLALDEDIPLLAEPTARVVMLTSSAASLPAARAQIDYIRSAEEGRLDLGGGLRELRERFAVQRVLCEGGPHLCCELLAEGLADELFLSLAPKLAGGEPSSGEALRILAGGELDPPVELELLSVLQSDSALFLRYGVSARERVSRETIASSSLAR
jgi:riboflavin biosynthesis pyrimidine reductase